MSERILLDTTGKNILSDFEPSDRAPEGEPSVCLGLITGKAFFRKFPNLEPSMTGRRRVKIVAILETGAGTLSHEAYDPEIHGDDPPQISLKEYEGLVAQIEANGTEVTRSLVTTRKDGASGGNPFDEDEAVLKAGGDPEAQVEKPSLSFRLKRR